MACEKQRGSSLIGPCIPQIYPARRAMAAVIASGLAPAAIDGLSGASPVGVRVRVRARLQINRRNVVRV